MSKIQSRKKVPSNGLTHEQEMLLNASLNLLESIQLKIENAVLCFHNVTIVSTPATANPLRAFAELKDAAEYLEQVDLIINEIKKAN